ncbi:hypothetical protein ACWERI_26250 [Streptomyces collinus]
MSATPEATVGDAATAPGPYLVVVPGLRERVAEHWPTVLAERPAGAGRAGTALHRTGPAGGPKWRP